jgi:hypothetical protein
VVVTVVTVVTVVLVMVVVRSDGHKGNLKIWRCVSGIRGIKMKGFPTFAVKPYAECVGEQELIAQEMGTCALLYNAVRTEDVSIVRYYQLQDEIRDETSKRVQYLGIRRSEDILFYCADTTKMMISVLSNNSATFQNKPLFMKPGVFKLLECSEDLMLWVGTLEVAHSISQSPQQAAAIIRAPMFSQFSPGIQAAAVRAVDSNSDSDSCANGHHWQSASLRVWA